jgi:cyclic-di-GMP phosphodiesterase TipF (flagellum assembly factor)
MGSAMMRLGAAFIALCMMIIAGSVAAVLYLAVGLSVAESTLAALAVLIALAVYNSASGRLRDRDDVSEQIADLSRGTADLARQVGELGRRIIAVETSANIAGDRAAAAAAPLAAEIQELGSLLNQLAETVAGHETRLAGAAAARGAPAAPSPAPPVVAAPALAALAPPPQSAAETAELGEPPQSQRALSGRFKGMEGTDILPLIRAAIEANRIDLYLQPIVSLPQRKVRYYEAEGRLRTEDGAVLLPDEFMSFAESGGLMPRIDNLMLFRCVQVVRRLTARNREIGLFCNISGSTLLDPEFFPQLTDFMQANRALAPSLVLEFEQSTMRAMGPLEHESLGAFTDLGFRFSLDHLVDLRLEPRELAERGFRFVKVPGSLLLNRVGPTTDIHPADFSDLLGRFGIDLIAEKIESEGMVVDLLDYDVRFGQGLLFSPPRPVRADALQGLGEPAREADAAEPAPAQTEGPEPPAAVQPAAPGSGPAAPAGNPSAPTAPRPMAEGRVSVLGQIARGMARRASPG